MVGRVVGRILGLGDIVSEVGEIVGRDESRPPLRLALSAG